MISLKKLLIRMSCPYQVGDIYITTKNYATDPSELWPWTSWEAFSVGRTLVGFDENDTDTTETFGQVGTTGGARGAWAHNHVMSIAYYLGSTGMINGEALSGARNDGLPLSGYNAMPPQNTSTTGSSNNTLPVDKANMPPYVVTYMWKRIG